MEKNKAILTKLILKASANENMLPDELIQKKRKPFYVLKTIELLFIEGVVKTFPFLKINTVAFRINNYLELILKLNPQFLYELGNIITEQEKEAYILKIIKPIFAQEKDRTLEERIEKRIKRDKNRKEALLKEQAIVNEFLKNRLQEVKDDPYYSKFFYWENEETETIDLISNRYLTVKNKQIFSFDTTYLSDNSYLTIFCDHGSQMIIGFIRTWLAPRSCELITFLEKYFTPIRLKRCRIIHCDRCGSNLSYEFIKFFEGKEMRLSHTSTKELENKKIHSNQLIENTNNCIKQIISNYKFTALGENKEFQDLTEANKQLFLEECVRIHNTTGTKRESKLLHGAPRILVDQGKEILYALAQKTGGEAIIIAKTGTEDGQYISEWHKLLITNTELLLLQTQFNEIHNTNLDIISANHLLLLERLGEKSDVESLQQFSKKTIEKRNELYSIVKNETQFKQVIFEREEIRNKIKNSMLERIKNAKTDNERKIIEENLGMLLLDETREKELMEIVKKIQEDAKIARQESSLANKKMEDHFQKQSSLIEKRQQKKTLKSREKYSFLPWDLPVLTEILKKGKNRFVVAKYRVAHIFLVATGIKISNLKFVNIEQLDNFVNYKTVRLKLTQGNNSRFMYFPHAKGRGKYIKIIKDDVEFLKECLKNNDPRLYKINKNASVENETSRSEIWGHASRPSLTAKMNGQLKEVGQLLKPNKKLLTTHSYRRGMGTLCGIFRGLSETKYLLGLESITSTEAYMPDSSSTIRRLKISLEKIYSVNYRKDIENVVMTPDQEHELIDELDKILEKERLQENDRHKNYRKKKSNPNIQLDPEEEEFDLPESDND